MSLAARYLFTDRRHGDLAIHSQGVERRRAEVVNLPWTWLNQVHGSEVVVVDVPGQHVGAEADAIVTACRGAGVAIQTADCAPIVLLAPGSLGVVHAGWRGIQAGVIQSAVEALTFLSKGPIKAVVGPCIHAECYEFGIDELGSLVDKFGTDVRSCTRNGSPALDLPATARAALLASGVSEVEVLDSCTACSSLHWSHRARGDVARQALVAWIED